MNGEWVSSPRLSPRKRGPSFFAALDSRLHRNERKMGVIPAVRPRESGDPAFLLLWIPACAGMNGWELLFWIPADAGMKALTPSTLSAARQWPRAAWFGRCPQ